MDKKRTLTYVWQALVIIVTVSAVIILSTLEGAWFNSISKGSVDTKEYSSAEIAKILSENSEDFDKAYDTVFSSEKLFENFNYERRIIAYSLSNQLKHYKLEKSGITCLRAARGIACSIRRWRPSGGRRLEGRRRRPGRRPCRSGRRRPASP